MTQRERPDHGSEGMMTQQPEMVFTAYRFTVGEGPFPWTRTAVIYHRADLSDVGEPYLSAIKDGGVKVASYEAYERFRKGSE